MVRAAVPRLLRMSATQLEPLPAVDFEGSPSGTVVHSPRRVKAVDALEDCPLTTRELEILRLAAQGMTNGRIARELWVTEQTVKFHLSNTYRKLDVANRTEASRYAHMHNLTAPRERLAS